MVVPSLEVDAPVIEVGQLENGQMGVPDNGEEVGWYEPGTMPGGSGNSVLAGHVDDLEGPAVFATLTEVEIGDQIFVYDESGEELIFEVDRIESYPFDDAPLSEIFGRTDEQRLNLITCTGIYNPDTRNHDERLVVYSKLVQEPDEEKKFHLHRVKSLFKGICSLGTPFEMNLSQAIVFMSLTKKAKKFI